MNWFEVGSLAGSPIIGYVPDVCVLDVISSLSISLPRPLQAEATIVVPHVELYEVSPSYPFMSTYRAPCISLTYKADVRQSSGGQNCILDRRSCYHSAYDYTTAPLPIQCWPSMPQSQWVDSPDPMSIAVVQEVAAAALTEQVALVSDLPFNDGCIMVIVCMTCHIEILI